MTTEQPEGEKSRSASFIDWVGSHVMWVTIGIIVVTIVAAPLAASRSQEDPNFDPSGEFYDTIDLVEERFQNSSPVIRVQRLLLRRQ